MPTELCPVSFPLKKKKRNKGEVGFLKTTFGECFMLYAQLEEI